MSNYFDKHEFKKYSIDDLSDATMQWDGSQVWVSDNSSTNTTMTGDLMFTDDNGVDHSVRDMATRIKALEDRLSILSDPDPETLKKHEMLREAYKKYRFIEELVGKESE